MAALVSQFSHFLIVPRDSKGRTNDCNVNVVRPPPGAQVQAHGVLCEKRDEQRGCIFRFTYWAKRRPPGREGDSRRRRPSSRAPWLSFSASTANYLTLLSRTISGDTIASHGRTQKRPRFSSCVLLCSRFSPTRA